MEKKGIKKFLTSGRVIGYYLKLDGFVDRRTKYVNKRSAVQDGIELLSKGITSTVGVVRANDQILLMTLTLNQDKQVVSNIK